MKEFDTYSTIPISYRGYENYYNKRYKAMPKIISCCGIRSIDFSSSKSINTVINKKSRSGYKFLPHLIRRNISGYSTGFISSKNKSGKNNIKNKISKHKSLDDKSNDDNYNRRRY